MVKIPGTSIWMSRTEVTWDLYDAFALSQPDSTERLAGTDAVARPTRPYGAPDYGWGHAGFPAISVAITGAEAFCAWLSERTGKRYRLPTEAEWERVAALAAAGKNLGDLAWHADNAAGMTHPVAKKSADAVGLFDLFGNAAEWVTVSSGKPAVRGGSFRDPPMVVGPTAKALRADSWNERDPQIPQSRWWMSDAPFVGFRIVRDP
jgi:formylglycine-generating enzyme required for sulfatase activity